METLRLNKYYIIIGMIGVILFVLVGAFTFGQKPTKTNMQAGASNKNSVTFEQAEEMIKKIQTGNVSQRQAENMEKSIKSTNTSIGVSEAEKMLKNIQPASIK